MSDQQSKAEGGRQTWSEKTTSFLTSIGKLSSTYKKVPHISKGKTDHHISVKHTVPPLFFPYMSVTRKKNHVSGVPTATVEIETPQILLICVDQLEK